MTRLSRGADDAATIPDREIWALINSVRDRSYDIFVFAEKQRMHNLVVKLNPRGLFHRTIMNGCASLMRLCAPWVSAHRYPSIIGVARAGKRGAPVVKKRKSPRQIAVLIRAELFKLSTAWLGQGVVMDVPAWGHVIAAVLDLSPRDPYPIKRGVKTWPGLDAWTLFAELQKLN